MSYYVKGYFINILRKSYHLHWFPLFPQVFSSIIINRKKFKKLKYNYRLCKRYREILYSLSPGPILSIPIKISSFLSALRWNMHRYVDCQNYNIFLLAMPQTGKNLNSCFAETFRKSESEVEKCQNVRFIIHTCVILCTNILEKAPLTRIIYIINVVHKQLDTFRIY